MKSDELLKLLEEVAPVSLSDEFCKTCNMYDNSGILIDCGGDINGVLFSLDFSLSAITEAKKRGFNAIVTHHPAIYGGIEKLLTETDQRAMAIKQCLKGGITVISMHLNYDAAPLGTDYFLMRGLGGEEERELMVRLSVGGYGRVFDIPQTPFFKYLEDIKTTFASERIISYGNGRKTVKTVASFCGAGADDEAIAFAVKNNADVFVSSDLKHHQIAELVGRGINVIQIPHYTSEVYGFKRIAQKLNEKLPVPSCFYRDKGLQ